MPASQTIAQHRTSDSGLMLAPPSVTLTTVSGAGFTLTM